MAGTGGRKPEGMIREEAGGNDGQAGRKQCWPSLQENEMQIIMVLSTTIRDEAAARLSLWSGWVRVESIAESQMIVCGNNVRVKWETITMHHHRRIRRACINAESVVILDAAAGLLRAIAPDWALY